MDLSDDIAYSVHDFEDAVLNGYLDPARLSDAPVSFAPYRTGSAFLTGGL